MPGRPHIFNAVSTVDVPESAANTETVVASIANVMCEFPGQQITINALLSVTPGTTATSMTWRIRRGGLTGTLVGEAESEAGDIVASKLTTLSPFAQDSPGEGAGLTYSVTIQGAGEGTAAVCAASSVSAVVQ